MKNFFLSFLILASIYTAYSAIVAPGSSAIGGSPSNGYVLQTNGATSTWVATSSLGISGGTNLLPLNNTWTGSNNFSTTSIENIKEMINKSYQRAFN